MCKFRESVGDNRHLCMYDISGKSNMGSRRENERGKESCPDRSGPLVVSSYDDLDMLDVHGDSY